MTSQIIQNCASKGLMLKSYGGTPSLGSIAMLDQTEDEKFLEGLLEYHKQFVKDCNGKDHHNVHIDPTSLKVRIGDFEMVYPFDPSNHIKTNGIDFPTIQKGDFLLSNEVPFRGDILEIKCHIVGDVAHNGKDMISKLPTFMRLFASEYLVGSRHYFRWDKKYSGGKIFLAERENESQQRPKKSVYHHGDGEKLDRNHYGDRTFKGAFWESEHEGLGTYTLKCFIVIPKVDGDKMGMMGRLNGDFSFSETQTAKKVWTADLEKKLYLPHGFVVSENADKSITFKERYFMDKTKDGFRYIPSHWKEVHQTPPTALFKKNGLGYDQVIQLLKIKIRYIDRIKEALESSDPDEDIFGMVKEINEIEEKVKPS